MNTFSRGNILRELVANGAMARAELAVRTGVSVATASRAVADLTAAGLVRLEGAGDTTGGRPRHLIFLEPRAAATLAVDVADTHTQCALISLTGELLWQECHPHLHHTGEDRLAHTITVTTSATRSASAHCDRLLAVGMSVPGPVFPAGTVQFAPVLGWHDVPLAEQVSQQIGAPVTVGNDANLIALAESAYGADRDATALVAIAVFAGIGSGMVFNGAVWDGSRGASGQLGRMLMSGQAARNVYAGFGDLETQLGSYGIARRAQKAGIALEPNVNVFKQVLVDLPKRNLAARKLADEVLSEFAMALINVCALLDPEVIVFAGEFVPISQVVLPQLARRIEGRVVHAPRLLAASTAVPGALLGAAILARSAFGPLDQLVATKS